MSKTRLPKDWDQAHVDRVRRHYEDQTDDEAIAEDEAAYTATTHTSMNIPVELVPKVRELIAKRSAG